MAATKFLPVSLIRDIMERIKSKYPQFTVTQSSLILRNVIANGQTNYVFQVNGSNPEAERPAIRLQQNDVFVGVEMGYFLKKEIAADPGTGKRYTWPNPATTAFGTAATDLECFYDAHLKIETDNRVIADPIYTGDFLYVPESIEKAGITDIETAVARDAFHPGQGFRELTPGFVFNGKRENKVALSLKGIPSPAWASATGGTDHLVEVHLRGLKLQGAAAAEYTEILAELMSR